MHLKLGLPYLGGKRAIAWKIVDKMLGDNPNCEYIWDLFGGGGAISFEAMQRQQIKQVYYNEIAENVKGLIQGNAKLYVKKIIQAFGEAGYKVQLFLLNAATMGVPQRRERVFFICHRNDLDYPKLKLEFSEKQIIYAEIEDKNDVNEVKNKKTRTYKGWRMSKVGQSFSDGINDGGSMFGYTKVNRNCVAKTVVSNSGTYEWHDKIFRKLNAVEHCQIGTYPLDYDFQDVEPKYLIGMSVPPVMMAKIATQIKTQWLND